MQFPEAFVSVWKPMQWNWGVNEVVSVLSEFQPGTCGSEVAALCLFDVEQAVVVILSPYSQVREHSGTHCLNLMLQSAYAFESDGVIAFGLCILPADMGNSLRSLWAVWIRDLLRSSSFLDL